MHKFLSQLGIAIALLAGSTLALANAGRVDFAVGDVTAQQASAQPRALVKGAEVLSGDKIVVRDGRAQIRFNDGAYVSLLPNTEFHIRDYRYSGKADGTERSWTSLLRGTVRAVSGLVGRVNKAAYQIETPTATLGIRGTAGIIEVALDGTTKITTTSGIWTMTNRAGTMEVPAGQAGIATPNQNQAPQRTAATAAAAPPAANEKPRQQARGDREQQGQQGQQQQARQTDAQFVGTSATGTAVPGANDPGSTTTQTTTTTPLPPLNTLEPPKTTTTAPPPNTTPTTHTFTMAAIGVTNSAGGDAITHNFAVGPTTFDDQPLGFTGQSGSPRALDPNAAQLYTGLPSGGTVTQWGATADKHLAWGRWEGSGLQFYGQQPENSTHFIRALPSLDINGATAATFTLQPSQGTTPTSSMGYTGAYLVSGTLNLNFSNPALSTLSWTLKAPLDASSGALWSLTAATGAAGGIALSNGPGNQLNIFGTTTPITGTLSGACASCPVPGTQLLGTVPFTANAGGVVTGNFSGAGGGGANAGMVYKINIPTPSATYLSVPGVGNTAVGGQTISGVAVFAR